MALAAKASVEQRSTVLMAMARSWMTLANQMDRLEASTIKTKIGKRRTRPAPKD